MFKPPAHRSGTAGCINMHADAGPLTRQIADFQSSDEYYERRQSMNTTQRGKLAAAIGREGLQEALKASDATHVSTDWESRYNGLVEAIKAIEAEYEASVGSDMDIYYATDKIFALVKENT